MKASKLLSQSERKIRRFISRQQVNLYPTFVYKFRSGLEPFLVSLIVDNELYLSPRHSLNAPMSTRIGSIRFQ